MGQILRQKKLFQESFSAFLEGHRKGDGTEKCSILVEAVASFSNVTGFFLFVEAFNTECIVSHIHINIYVHQAFFKCNTVESF